jgi:uncharacterized cofD-like protein
MQLIPSKHLFSELHRTTYRQANAPGTPLEHLVEYLLTGILPSSAPSDTKDLANRVLRFDLRGIRVTVLGGGTGMSTIVGGNAQMPEWPDQPDTGLKQDFRKLNSVVCTTDDGGSTGRLVRSLPMIGIGDLRKLLLSSILLANLKKRYGLGDGETGRVIRTIHGIFNHRFDGKSQGFRRLKNPLLAVPPELRHACPKPLEDSLIALGSYISPGGGGPTILPAGHSLGNLLLAAAIFMAARGRLDRPPGFREIQKGIDCIAGLIGAPIGQIHPATATPGQLKFRYANGIEVYGQSKSAWARRDSPVQSVAAEFTKEPMISASVQRAIAGSDLIIYAPGSLYTSIIPILQLEPIADAIRSNRKALKILGANSWIQKGETDISIRNQGRGFLVSELIDAYERNIPHGIDGLIDVVLSANLEQIPGNILGNYALEGKSPLHLDRSRVDSMGFRSVEATLLSMESQIRAQVIHHDARRFSLAIRTLVYADKFLKKKKGYTLRRFAPNRRDIGHRMKAGSITRKPKRSPLLCDYFRSAQESLDKKKFRPSVLRDFLLKLAWENRDIHPSHFSFFRGGYVIPAGKWDRSTEWDDIQGYFDPKDRNLKLHEDLLADPARLGENMLIALGESLLGRYIESRRWIDLRSARCYEIALRPSQERECFLTDSQLHKYLQLTRMTPDPVNRLIYRITINADGGFIPPGLLFGLLYAWYLSGRGFTMEYEMTLLRWPLKNLIPLHARDRIRKEALVTFFRTEVFGHK